MNATKLVLFPSFVAVAALAVVLFRSDASARSTEGAAVGLALDERLAALEARIDALAARRSSPPVVSARALVEPDDEELARLEVRLQLLEARAWSIADLRQQGFRVLRLGHDEATLAAWTEEALDDDASAEKRLAAFARLRGQVRDDTRDARLAALESMLALARTTDDPTTRAAIYAELSGLTDPSLVAPLMDSMRGDSSVEVRIAAASTLASFRADDAVRAALELALEQDPDEYVKDAAFEALSGQPRRAVADREER